MSSFLTSVIDFSPVYNQARIYTGVLSIWTAILVFVDAEFLLRLKEKYRTQSDWTRLWWNGLIDFVLKALRCFLISQDFAL